MDVSGPQRQEQVSGFQRVADGVVGRAQVGKIMGFHRAVPVHGVDDGLAAHSFNGQFAGGVNVRHKDEVRRLEHLAEVVRQHLGARVAVRLDALNSLIGSPLGYIGSDGGELLKRVCESDVGLILIDEFEKANNAVFNYFLDVLENGKIVNSQADEYDINGYIIVFTSNITKENFKNKIKTK